MSPDASAVVTVGLSKTYPGGARAVTSLDAQVAVGEALGLLGPNGAGKTTQALWDTEKPCRPLMAAGLLTCENY